MSKRAKTGNVSVPLEDFHDENITAHISIRLPLNLLKNLRKPNRFPFEKARRITLEEVSSAHKAIEGKSGRKKLNPVHSMKSITKKNRP